MTDAASEAIACPKSALARARQRRRDAIKGVNDALTELRVATERLRAAEKLAVQHPAASGAAGAPFPLPPRPCTSAQP